MNRKCRFFTAIILAALITAILLPVVALADGPFVTTNATGDWLPRFIDEEGLLTAEQAAILTVKLDEISERNQFDTVVAVVRSLHGQEARVYAADFFEQNGFGYGRDIDGAILLLATEYRDFGFASFGFGMEAFTPAGQAYLDKLVIPYLKEDQYYEAFMAYADAVDDFLAKAVAGTPYGQDNIPKTASEIRQYRLIGSLIALALALIIAIAVTGSWKRQLISVRKENLAHGYIREGSMVLTDQRDIFLHRQVKKVRRAENSSSGGGGSFKSSSGRSATGHSGKY